jgi:AdoMet-dependent heme synthase
MPHPSYTVADFDRNPLMFYYEITRACDLVCKHCRASAQEQAAPDELSTELSKALIAQAATFPKPPMVVLTGGDPLKRGDLFELIAHAVQCHVEPVLTPSATPLATYAAFARAKEAGVKRLGISLDGPDAVTHDAFRGWEGSFQRTLGMLNDARRLGLFVQVNTSITKRNFDKIDAMAELLRDQGIAMWSVFFLIPVGRGVEEQRIAPEEYEVVFAKLFAQSRRQPYAIKTTEAPHYRRFVLQQGGDPLAGPQGRDDGGMRRGHRAPLGVGDGKGVMFVSHCGEIYPAGFLPLLCGRFPQDSVVDVYQNHPTFRALRNPDGFRGRCGVCEYRYVCGGSRARAYAVTGDPLETEPDCVYIPSTGAPVIAADNA